MSDIVAVFRLDYSVWYGRIVPREGRKVWEDDIMGQKVYHLQPMEVVSRTRGRIVLQDDLSYPIKSWAVCQCIRVHSEPSGAGALIVPPLLPNFNDQPDYAARLRVFDPNKVQVHRLIRSMVGVLAPEITSALVLDCSTFNTARSLQFNFKALRKRGIVVVNRHAKPSWRRAGVKVVKAELKTYLSKCRDEYDLVFLDHCGTFRKEKECLDLVLKRDLVDGVLVATYSIRGNGNDTSEDVVKTIRAYVRTASRKYKRTVKEIEVMKYNRMVVFFWHVQ